VIENSKINEITRLPNFICIGAQKAGTSWLDAMLREHPDVWLPPKKELHYFDCKYFLEHKKWDIPAKNRVLTEKIKSELIKRKVNFSYIKYLASIAEDTSYSEDWYRKCFRNEDAQKSQVIGDITPEYSMIPREGTEYMKGLLPNLKIIYIIRDPVDRAWSQVKMRVSRRNLMPEEIVWEKMFTNKDIVSRGNYKSYIPKWKSVFDSNDLLFIPFGEIKSNPRGIIREVEEFLSLRPFEYENYQKVVHENKVVLKKPEEYMHILEGAMAEQYTFLKQCFDEKFLTKIN